MVFQSNWFRHPYFEDISLGRKVLSAGALGEPVRMLQTALVGLGYRLPESTKQSGELDGVFGNETYLRLRDFQKKAFPGKAPDGVVGKGTLGELDSRLQFIQPPSSSDAWSRSSEMIPGAPDQSLLGRNFAGMTAIRQTHDMACWAACLSFWAKVLGGGRPQLDQSRLIALCGHLVHTSTGPKIGGMPTQGLAKILTPGFISPEANSDADKNMQWKATMRDTFPASNLTVSWLKNNTRYRTPIMIGYTINGMSHVNVIGYYEMDEDDPYVWVMEPWVGSFFLRRVEYYQSSTRTFIVQQSLLP